MSQEIISTATIKDTLGKGIQSGDTLLVHSSLSAIGWLEDGPQGLIYTLLELIGAAGNLVMLTPTRDFARSGIFDIVNSPSDVGTLSETFRLTEGVSRSCNPMVSVAAIGPDSHQFLQQYNSYIESTSPFSALIKLDGKIMLYGVDYDKCTLYHLSEERTKVKYNFYKTFNGELIDDRGQRQKISQTYYVRRDMSLKKDARPVGRRFESLNQIFRVKVGKGDIRIFNARLFDEFCTREISDNPDVFIATQSQKC